MKKLSIRGIITATIIAVAGVIFFACKKDGDEKFTKNASSSENTELGVYENYVPDESIVYEKLSQVMQCMNEPSANPMPGMELKEAVWFLEAFFNLGVCSHQEYAMDTVIGKKEYVIRVPIESWNTDGSIILKGEVLQTKYRDFLNEIISDLCGEYTINFGDMYVSALYPATNEVSLGLTALYGSKSQKAFGVRKIADPQNYPTLTSPTPNLYPCFYVYELSQPKRDEGMEALLNQIIVSGAVGIWNVKNYLPSVTIPVYREHVKGMNDYTKNLYITTWEQYGTSYRNYIYLHLSFYHNYLPPNPLEIYAPLYAFCEVWYGKYNTPLGDITGEAYHKFGLEYVHHISCLNPTIDWSKKIFFEHYRLVWIY
jgi:hypothetical protein